VHLLSEEIRFSLKSSLSTQTVRLGVPQNVKTRHVVYCVTCELSRQSAVWTARLVLSMTAAAADDDDY